MSAASVVLINTNEMKPAVAPIALDYLASALRTAGREADLLDLTFAPDASAALQGYFRDHSPRLVGLTFRNSDDCFWPSAKSFVPRLAEIVGAVRKLTDARLVIGGNGFSLFPEAILDACSGDFGVAGDGEEALPPLLLALERGKGLERVPGPIWRADSETGTGWTANPPARSDPAGRTSARDFVDNARYFREGGQGNVETKRGCDGACVYCADPVCHGERVRAKPPDAVCAEIEALLRQGVDVLHLCDCEFNRPPAHALAVCREMIARGLGRRTRWYTYASITPFSEELARAMREAGCVGINFGADSANARMLASYGRPYRAEDIAAAVAHCRRYGIAVMVDLLLGGPGETEETLRETIAFMKAVSPDCVGAALGLRVYPGTELARRLRREGPLAANPNLRRPAGMTPANEGASHAEAEALLRPVFYISRDLGENPARLVRDLIAGDTRFFEPMEEQGAANYNYNDNRPLVEAIRNGARGAYWHILRQMRRGSRAASPGGESRATPSGSCVRLLIVYRYTVAAKTGQSRGARAGHGGKVARCQRLGFRASRQLVSRS